MRDFEVVLPKRVVHQPVPFLQNGGDCGACVLAGLLDRDVPWVYRTFLDGKYASFHWSSMRDALHGAEARGLLDRVMDDVPMWPWAIHQPFAEWGHHAGFQNLAWFKYLTMAFDAGYYALALVDIHKKGPFGGGTNHWVMLCGVRVRREPYGPEFPGNFKIIDEVLVSCSSTRTPDEEWVEPGKFLIERGGFNLLLARPRGASGTVSGSPALPTESDPPPP